MGCLTFNGAWSSYIQPFRRLSSAWSVRHDRMTSRSILTPRRSCTRSKKRRGFCGSAGRWPTRWRVAIWPATGARDYRYCASAAVCGCRGGHCWSSFTQGAPSRWSHQAHRPLSGQAHRTATRVRTERGGSRHDASENAQLLPRSEGTQSNSSSCSKPTDLGVQKPEPDRASYASRCRRWSSRSSGSASRSFSRWRTPCWPRCHRAQRD